MTNWSSKQIEHNVVMVDVPVKQRADWEWWLLLTSDHHLDSPKCNRELLKRHLQEAVNRNAGIHFNGDVLDLMQGVGDKGHLNLNYYAHIVRTMTKIRALISIGL